MISDDERKVPEENAKDNLKDAIQYGICSIFSTAILVAGVLCGQIIGFGSVPVLIVVIGSSGLTLFCVGMTLSFWRDMRRCRNYLEDDEQI